MVFGNNNPVSQSLAMGAGLGIIIGTVIGALTDNVGLWIALGLVFGAGIGLAIGKARQAQQERENGETPDPEEARISWNKLE